MNKRISLIFVCILLLLAIVLPVQAQDDGGEEDATAEFLALIFAANDNLYAAGSFSYEATQAQRQIISSGVGLRRSQLERESTFEVIAASIVIDNDGRPTAFDARMRQTDVRIVNEVNRESEDLSFNYQLRLVDDEALYIRVTGLDGSINADSPQGIDPEEFRTGWVNLSEQPEQLSEDLAFLNSENNDRGFLEALNLDGVVDLGTGITWSESSVVRVRQILSDDEDERIFDVELDPMLVLQDLSLLNAVNNDTLAGDPELLLQEMFENATLSQTVTLELDSEGIPSLTRVETTLDIDVEFSDGTGPGENPADATGGVPLELRLESLSIVDFDDIGDEFEILMPEPEIILDSSCDTETLEVVFTITNNGANMATPASYTLAIGEQTGNPVEIQLEAGSREVVAVEDGEFTLAIADLELTESIACVAEEEETGTES